jgi:phosphate/sulfate permease
VRIAEDRCSVVVDKNNRANCIFDVSATGNLGFAKTYETSEQLQPGLTRTAVKDDSDPTIYGEKVSFTATVQPTLRRGPGAPGGTVQFILDGSNAGDPVALDSNGRAAWSTSSLQAGKHLVVANYIPSGFGGGIFLASTSPEESHTVITSEQYFWLIVLLGVIILIGLIVLGYRLARS